MKKEFKFGDRVTLTKTRDMDRSSKETLGKIGVVVAKAYNGDYTVIFEGDAAYNPMNGFLYSTQFYSEEYLEQA